MTPEERVQALQALGYRRRHAAFLALVAIHSGCFVRRQWQTFTGTSSGRYAVDFLAALIARGHARAVPYALRTSVYHLQTRTLFAAIDEEHHRHRPRVDLTLVTQKLMTLDVVLAHADHVWYGTEREKVELFTERYGVDVASLPAKVYRTPQDRDRALTRHFVEKFPIAVAPPAPDVLFTFINTWGRTADGLCTFLRAYERLFSALPSVRVLYVSAASDWGAAAREAVVRLYRSRRSEYRRDEHVHPGPPEPSERAALARHFLARQQMETGDWSTLPPDEVSRLRGDLLRFRGPAYDHWYHAWQREGDAIWTGEEAGVGEPIARQGIPKFETYHLPYRYPGGSLQAVVGLAARKAMPDRSRE